MKVYISGSITKNRNYKLDFANEQAKQERNGNEVINPALVLESLPTSTTWDEYMTICYRLIDMCDAVAMIVNWGESKGACIEYGYALGKGKTII